MAKGIKGITIELGGDTTGLDKALKSVNATVKSLQGELKEVNRDLKFNPDSPVLLSQKMTLLQSAVIGTAEKLEVLKNAQADVQRQFDEGKISEEQYRAFQRELVNTEAQLGRYEKQVSSTGKTLKDLEETTNGSSKGITTFGKAFDDAFKNINNSTKNLQNELKQVDAALKFDTDNPVLLSQKMDILKDAVANTSEKMKLLENVQEDVQRKFDAGEIPVEEYREFQRNLESTGAELKNLESQLSETEEEVKNLGNATDESSDDVTQFGQAFNNAVSSINDSTKNLQNELKQVDAALKFDTDNPVLLSQKMDILKNAVSNTSEKLKLLENAQDDVNKKFADGEISEEQYREFQREIEKTKSELKNFESQITDTDNEMKGLNKTADDSSDEVKDLGKSFDDANEKVISFGNALKASIVAEVVVNAVKKAISVVKEFSKELIENAATIQAEQAQFTAAFAELEDDAVKMIASISNETQILDERLKLVATSGFSQFKGAGMDANQALASTEQFITNAADAAAYFDISVEDASEKLRSFVRGNTAAGDSIGLFTSEAQRNDRAVELMGKKYKDLTEAQKQMVMLDIVDSIYSVNGAMGQAAREADGWENVQGNLNEAWRQFTAVLGAPILGVITPIVQDITAKITEMKPVAEEVAAVVGEKFSEIVVKIRESAGFISDEIIPKVIGGFNLLKDNAPAITAVIAGITAAFVALKAVSVGAAIATGIANIVNGFKLFTGAISTASVGATAIKGVLAALTSPVGLAVAAIAALTAGVVYLYKTNDDFREKFLTVWENVKEGLTQAVTVIVEKVKAFADDVKVLFEKLKPTIEEVINNIKIIVETVFNNLKEFWNEWGATITQAFTSILSLLSDTFQTAWDNIKTIVEGAVDIIAGIIKTVTGIITGDWSLAWEGVKDIVSGAYETITEVLGNIITFVTGFNLADAGNGVMQGLADGISNGLNNVKEKLSSGMSVISGVADTFLTIWEKVKEGFLQVVNIIVEKIKSFVDDVKVFFGKIKPIIDETMENIKTIVQAAFNFLKEYWEKWGTVIVQVFTNRLKAVSDAFQVGLTLVKAIAETIFNNIKTFWNTWGSTITQYFKTTLNMVLNVFELVWNNIKAVVEGAVNIVSGIIKTVTGIITGDWDKAWEGVKQTISGAWEVITTVAGNIYNTVKHNLGEMVNFISGIDLEEIGRNIIQGLSNGISRGLENAKEVVSKGIESIKSRFTGITGFDIHSPSKWAEKIARFVGDGLSGGFLTSLADAGDVAGQGLDGIKSIFQEMADDRRLHDVAALEDKILLIDKEVAETKKALEREQYERDLAEKRSNLNTAKNAKERESIQKDINKMIADNEKKLNDERLADEKAFLQNKINLIKESQNMINDLGSALVSALKTQYEKQRDAHLSSLEKEVDDVRKANDKKLKEYENDYLNKISFMDSELAEQIKAINNQIAGIDAQTDAEEKALREQEYNKQLAEKQKALSAAESAEEIAKIQEEINAMMAKRERELLLARRTEEKNSLRTQIETIKEDYAERKKLLKEDYENQKENAKDTLDNFVDSKDKEMKKAKEHFDQLLSEENLNAEARKMLIEGNNEDIINILSTYNPRWLDQGRTFADKLLNGINEGRPAIENAISDIMNLLNGVNANISETLNNASAVSATVNNSIGDAFKDIESYTVAYGDTLTSIAKKYNTTVDALVSANAIQDRNKIYSGQNITIPINVQTTLDGKVISENVSEHMYNDYSKAARY